LVVILVKQEEPHWNPPETSPATPATYPTITSVEST